MLPHHCCRRLDGIYEAIKENALLLSSSLVVSATTGRRCGHGLAHQRHQWRNQGVVPFLKSGERHRRRGEPGWQAQGRGLHLSNRGISTSKSSTRAAQETPATTAAARHDMNTANWIPTLFMKRVFTDSDLDAVLAGDTRRTCDLFGKAFEAKLHRIQAQGRAVQLKPCGAPGSPRCWRICSPCCSRRASVDHLQRIRATSAPAAARWRGASSNLCTTLNTSETEIAVRNLLLGQPCQSRWR